MSSGFVTETELAEARKKRQEEWEKVRQPVLCEIYVHIKTCETIQLPEEPYDSRSLFERLKEQKDKKDLEYEEAHKLKNMIRGLDDDEINFLDIVDKAKMDAEKRQQMQEDNELSEFREHVASLQEQTIDKKLSIEKVGSKSKTVKPPSRPSQKSILAGIVRKRSANETAESGNDKIEENIPEKVSKPNGSENKSSTQSETGTNSSVVDGSSKKIDLSVHDKGALKCIGILPGIGKYQDSSDSEKSTDTDDEYDFSDFDWVGRKVKRNEDDDCH